MWTLIVFTMLAGRGTSTSVATLEFPTQQSCAAAAAVLAEQGDMGGPASSPGQGVRPAWRALHGVDAHFDCLPRAIASWIAASWFDFHVTSKSLVRSIPLLSEPEPGKRERDAAEDCHRKE
jgi:hypothetical protein